MLLVDTNLVVPLYIRSARSQEVEQLRELDGFWRTEPLASIEFSNVLATFEGSGLITAAEARQCLARAEAWLGPLLFPVPHQVALKLAMRYGVTPYDARFLALADQFGDRLVTEDARLRAAAPTLSQSLTEALALA